MTSDANGQRLEAERRPGADGELKSVQPFGESERNRPHTYSPY